MKLLSNEQGMILVISLVFLAILTMLAAFMVSQSITGLKITTALRDYEKAFNLSDGACQIGVGYLTTASPKSKNWNPTQKVQIEQGTLPSHMQQITVHDTHGQEQGHYLPEISWMGYDAKPMPGWMLNWQGYSSYYRIHYLANGEATLPNRPAPTDVDALLVKIER